MKKFKEINRMIRKNIGTILGFEGIFKVITFLIFVPLFLDIFNLIMKVTGYNYLTLENIFSFVLNPLTLSLLLILVFFMMIYSMFEVTTLIIILDQSYQDKKIKIIDAIRISIRKCKRLFSLKNISLAFMILFLMPFLNLGFTSSFIKTIHIPEFISEFIANDRILLTFFVILVAFLVSVFLKWIYAIHYFILEDVDFKEARIKSKKLGEEHHLKDLFWFVSLQIVTAIVYTLFIVIGVVLIIFLDQLFSKIIIFRSITTTIIFGFVTISFIIINILANPISYAVVSSLYYLHKKDNNEQIRSIEVHTNQRNIIDNNKLKKLVYVLSLIAVLGGSIFTYGVYNGKYNLNIEHARTLEVTAHRGDSIDYPENTMSAFEGAKKLGTDWIELDVQQTKDGKIIVIHDTNFKRTTGVDKNTWELTSDEVKELDAGSWFDEKYKGAKIPFLEEVIEFAKINNIRLNIELKPTGYETNFEKNVVDIINKTNFKDRCVVTSLVYDVLENVKEYDKDIQTVYVMGLAYGDITALKAANHFSIEASSISKNLVSRIHKEGKQIYAWTVNTEESIQKMVDLNVDNIITDNIELAKDIIYASKTSNVLNEYIKRLENIF
ncbi:MAG: glycerophosphodiester phosphodiesterase [Clostridia bacterium]|nr:glycerophosphodiester phosphodiesterase [Clostridia bacterium]